VVAQVVVAEQPLPEVVEVVEQPAQELAQVAAL
jgi:hypothetical protein